MQIKRLLDDREVLVGERVFGAQGRSNSFVEHSGGAGGERTPPSKLNIGCWEDEINRII